MKKRFGNNLADDQMPYLQHGGRKDIADFLDEYERYRRVIEYRHHVNGKRILPVPMIYCVEPNLLSVMNYEIGLISLEQLTDDKLEKYLLSCLSLNEDFVPDLSNLFGNLRLARNGDCRRRVLDLFRTVKRIIRENGLGNAHEKIFNEFIINALPREPRILALRKIEFKGRANFRKMALLFPLVLKCVEICEYNDFSSSSSNKSMTRGDARLVEDRWRVAARRGSDGPHASEEDGRSKWNEFFMESDSDSEVEEDSRAAPSLDAWWKPSASTRNLFQFDWERDPRGGPRAAEQLEENPQPEAQQEQEALPRPQQEQGLQARVEAVESRLAIAATSAMQQQQKVAERRAVTEQRAVGTRRPAAKQRAAGQQRAAWKRSAAGEQRVAAGQHAATERADAEQCAAKERRAAVQRSVIVESAAHAQRAEEEERRVVQEQRTAEAQQGQVARPATATLQIEIPPAEQRARWPSAEGRVAAERGTVTGRRAVEARRSFTKQRAAVMRSAAAEQCATERQSATKEQRAAVGQRDAKGRYAAATAQRSVMMEREAQAQRVVQEQRAVQERHAAQEQRAEEEQRVADQAAAHAHRQLLLLRSGTRVERQEPLPRQRLVEQPRAAKGPLAATAAPAPQEGQPVLTGPRLLGTLLDAQKRARALDAMVFGTPGPPEVGRVVEAA